MGFYLLSYHSVRALALSNVGTALNFNHGVEKVDDLIDGMLKNT